MKSVLHKAFLIVFWTFCSAKLLFAQKSEVGLLVGPSYYYGDIVNTFQPLSARVGGSFFYRYHLDPQLSIRGNAAFLQIGGKDENSNTDWQKRRNMSFVSNIFEVSAVGEYNFIPDRNKGRRVRDPLIPYAFLGVGGIYFESYRQNPATGENVLLRPLQLDGTSYAPIAIVVPFGFGARYYLSSTLIVGIEVGFRWSSSSQLDNVDGASTYPSPEQLPSDLARAMFDPSVPLPNGSKLGQPGRPRGKIDYINDIYVLSGVSISYRLWPKGVKKYGGKAIRCPRFY